MTSPAGRVTPTHHATAWNLVIRYRKGPLDCQLGHETFSALGIRLADRHRRHGLGNPAQRRTRVKFDLRNHPSYQVLDVSLIEQHRALRFRFQLNGERISMMLK